MDSGVIMSDIVSFQPCDNISVEGGAFSHSLSSCE